GREAGVDGAGVARHLGAGPGEEPLDQTARCPQLSPDDGSPQRQGARLPHLAEELGAAIEILGVGTVVFRVPALAPGEDAVRADVDQPGAGSLAQVSEPVWEERVHAQTNDRVLCGRQLLDDSDTVDYHVGAYGRHRPKYGI